MAERLPVVKPPSGPRNAPTTTMRVGTSRNAVVYAKKGTTPARAPGGRYRPRPPRAATSSPNGVRPLLGEDRLGLVRLGGRRNDRRRDSGQGGGCSLVHGAALVHLVEQDRLCATPLHPVLPRGGGGGALP